jgi:Ca2+-binding EF-hand superfamily protein
MKKLLIGFIVCFLSMLAVASEHEQSAPTAAAIETAFADLDVDTDGYINQEEATADESLNQVFAAIAKDGKVDEKSFADWKALSGLEQN